MTSLRGKTVLSIAAVVAAQALAGCGAAGDGSEVTLHAVLRAPTDVDYDEEFDPAVDDLSCTIDGLFTGQRLSILDGKDVVGFAQVRAGAFELEEGYPSGCASTIVATFEGTSSHRVLRIGSLDQAFSVEEAEASSAKEPVTFTLPPSDL